MNVINAFDSVFPVLGGHRINAEKANKQDISIYDSDIGKKIESDEKLERPVSIKNVLGTCFCVTGNLFLTAGHVLNAELQYDYRGVGFNSTGRYQGVEITNYEIDESIDIGIFEADLNGQIILPMRFGSLPMSFPVKTCGFPFSLDCDLASVSIKTFDGTIVSSTRLKQLERVPKCYELSFICPRGLSGAPLWSSNDSEDIRVIGVVLGNSITEIEIYSETEKEITNKGERETTFIKTESMHLGSALEIEEVLNTEFSLTDGELGARL